MKNTIKYSTLLLLSAAIVFSCQKEKGLESSVEEIGESHIFTCVLADNDDTKMAIDSDGKTTWEVGDQIFVHAGTDGNISMVITLGKSDISASGKIATIDVKGLEPYVHKSGGVQDYTSTYYAIYPASAVTSSANMYYNTRLDNLSKPAMGAYDDGAGHMIFRNLCAVIQFTVSGEFDKFSFSGNNGETISYSPQAQWRVALPISGKEMFEFKPTSDGATCNPQTTISGSVVADGVTTNYICLTGHKDNLKSTLSKGFTLSFIDSSTDKVVKVLSTQTAMTLSRNDYLHLGDITDDIQDPKVPSTHTVADALSTATDLSTADGPANSYIITTAGIYKFPAVQGNDDTKTVGYVHDVKLVWATYNTDVAPTETSIIEQIDFDGTTNYVYFKTPSTLKAGNALIAAKDQKGRIIWSWHIWIPDPDDPIDDTKNYGIYDHNLMDRNLGALNAAIVDAVAPVESFGLMYQWGRKDPFMGPEANNSSTPAAVFGTVASNSTGKITLTESLRNPTVLGNPQAGWHDWLTPSDNNLWKDGAKTVYDPCPPGYRVPARNKSYLIHKEDPGFFADASFEYNTTNKYWILGTPSAVFPITGYYDDWAYASWPRVDYINDRSALWNAHVGDEASAYCTEVRSDRGRLSSRGKSALSSVRCCVDD